LLRPAELIQARSDFDAKKINAQELHAAEDLAIANVVKRQEACGFQVVVDGEFRRENWWIDFVRGLSGVEIQEGQASQAFVAPKGNDCGHDHAHDEGWICAKKCDHYWEVRTFQFGVII
jgi:5-methyltetrahydropteroyltriglutamate--homocysteine methyltransferase